MGERSGVSFYFCISSWSVRRGYLLTRLTFRCFLLPLKRAHLELPYLARESELEVLKLPAERKVDYMRCHEVVYDQVS